MLMSLDTPRSHILSGKVTGVESEINHCSSVHQSVLKVTLPAHAFIVAVLSSDLFFNTSQYLWWGLSSCFNSPLYEPGLNRGLGVRVVRAT